MRLFVPLAFLILMGCHSDESNSTDLSTRTVTLPDGFVVTAEVKIDPEEMARGMMYRTELPTGRGMLFVHGQMGHYAYWMANCKIPLDIIWMDTSHKVVEISANTPPCPSGDKTCPTYGGRVTSSFGFELAAGQAAKHNVIVGSTIQF
ncbi:MAG TPA: DUF192 domain-containing protein [Bryobacteraceae bacterium]|jgi:hypothetical protein